MNVTAFASGVPAQDLPDREDIPFPGQGYIAADQEGDGPGEGDMIDISVPANGFFWYANEDTKNAGNYGYYDIQSAKYTLTNNSETVNLEVTLKSYSQNGALKEIEDNLDKSRVIVGLAGDLYDADAANLLNNPVSDILYDTKLGAEESWDYSFYGEYQNTVLPSDPQTSDYVMVLQFEAISSVGQ